MAKRKMQIDLNSLIPDLVKSDTSNNRKDLYEIVRRVNSQQENRLPVKKLKPLFRLHYNDHKNTKTTKVNNHNNCPIRINQLLATRNETSWIVRDLLPKKGITILSGDPGSFKTWSTLHFALCVSSGEPVFGQFETTKSNVLIIDEEDGVELLQQRLLALSADKNSEIYFMVMSGFKSDDPNKMDELKRHIKKYNIRVVIIDSLIRIHGGEENSSKDIAKMFEGLRSLTAFGVTILINHHHRKKGPEQQYDQSPMRGSSDILAAIDCHMQIKHKDDGLRIIQTKNRFQQEIQPFNVAIVSDNNKITLLYSGEGSLDDKTDKAKNAIIKLLTDSDEYIGRQEINQNLSGIVGENSIGKMLEHLQKEGRINVLIGSKGKKTYRINDSPDSVF